jgi:acetyl-CoA decarbonylase/synthase complex subunit gamma
MNLASGKAELDACPHISEEAKEKLASVSAPPIRTVELGSGEYARKIGGETVAFRHEKTFNNPPILACMVSTDEDESSVEGKVERFKAAQFERVGVNLRPEAFFVKDASDDPATYKAFVEKLMGMTEAILILGASNPEVMKAGLEVAKDRKPLAYAVNMQNGPKMAPVIKEAGCAVAMQSDGSIDTVVKIAGNLNKAGFKDMVIDTGTRDMKQAFEEQVMIRRSALEGYRPLGFPTITFPCEMASSLDEETTLAAMFMAKYGGIIVMSDFQPQSLFPLLLSRLNIFTDPQRPMTAEQGIYPVNNPKEDSPVLVTCNFSLTYFIVSGEIETSREPAWLLVLDTEGLSVMTAWAAGKFSGESVATFVTKCGITDKVSHKSLVIPGYAAGISGELEEDLEGWNITVGPREASQIPAFLKSYKPE